LNPESRWINDAFDSVGACDCVEALVYGYGLVAGRAGALDMTSHALDVTSVLLPKKYDKQNVHPPMSNLQQSVEQRHAH
jgi:hypothetical protein